MTKYSFLAPSPPFNPATTMLYLSPDLQHPLLLAHLSGVSSTSLLPAGQEVAKRSVTIWGLASGESLTTKYFLATYLPYPCYHNFVTWLFSILRCFIYTTHSIVGSWWMLCGAASTMVNKAVSKLSSTEPSLERQTQSRALSLAFRPKSRITWSFKLWWNPVCSERRLHSRDQVDQPGRLWGASCHHT